MSAILKHTEATWLNSHSFTDTIEIPLLHRLRTLEEELQKVSEAEEPTGFPAHVFEKLRTGGWLTIVLPGRELDFQRGELGKQLDLLRIVGKGNLAAGRIYEGHINALYLIHLYGSEEQKAHLYKEAEEGHLFGVWNTEAADGLSYTTNNQQGLRASGCKTFCSGSLHVTRPIVPGSLLGVDGASVGWQMAILPLDQHQQHRVDASFWKPMGMQSSVSYKIDFTNITVDPVYVLGEPNQYQEQPYFSGGAVRFAAVQQGGAEAIFDATRSFLQKLNRTEDPYQQMRLGQMAIKIETGRNWLRQVEHVFNQSEANEQIIEYANATRSCIAEIGTNCIDLATQCVGARGLLHPEPFARLFSDLTMYLRQPAPDRVLASVGSYVLSKSDTSDDLWRTV